MNPNPDKAFEAFLTQHLQQTGEYLPDDGFTARVMGQLPAAEPRGLSSIVERLLAIVPALLVAAVVSIQFPWGHTFANVWYMAAQLEISQGFTFAVGAAGSLLLAAVFWYWQTEENF